MAKKKNKDQEQAEAAACGDAFVSDDGALKCVRDGRHLVHRDGVGTRFVRVPGGALVADPK